MAMNLADMTKPDPTALPPTLPLGTPAKEWSENTQELLTTKVEGDGEVRSESPAADGPSEERVERPKAPRQPDMVRGESQSSLPPVPGGWAKEWPRPSADQMARDASDAAAAVTSTAQNTMKQAQQTIQEHLNDPASPVNTTLATVQEAVGSAMERVKSTVPGTSKTVDPTAEEPTVAPAGLLPAPEPSSVGEVKDYTVEDATDSAATGGAKINTVPPPGDLHPSTSDTNPNPLANQATKVGFGEPSPVDAIPAGSTRTNFESTHTGNYAMTDLPTKEGNITDPHAGASDQKGIVEKAKDAVGLNGKQSPIAAVQEAGAGYLASAMAAVGFGAGAAAVEEERKEEDRPLDPVIPQPHVAGAAFEPGQNILSGALKSPEAEVSPHGVDQDVQTALARAEGRPAPTFEDDERSYKEGSGAPKVEAVNEIAKKEHDLAAEIQGTPDVDAKPPAIQTTSNSYIQKEAQPTSPATEVNEYGHKDSPKDEHPIHTTTNTGIAPAAVATSPATAVAAGTVGLPSVPADHSDAKAKGIDGEPAVTTTTNTMGKAAPPATSPATDVAAATGGKVDGEAEKDHSRDTTGNGTSSSGGEPSSPSYVKGHKKGPSLKDRIRGDFKIFTGKLSGNEHKVEEGRALKTGGSSVASTPVTAKTPAPPTGSSV